MGDEGNFVDTTVIVASPLSLRLLFLCALMHDMHIIHRSVWRGRPLFRRVLAGGLSAKAHAIRRIRQRVRQHYLDKLGKVAKCPSL